MLNTGIVLGIDPGWGSLGISVQQYGKVLMSESMVPKDSGDITSFVNYLGSIPEVCSAETAFIERFVTYAGVQTDGEMILMCIGGILHLLESPPVSAKVHLVRAIDWKMKLSKYLVRANGLRNPYESFDKKYSLWAAEQLSGVKPKKDHEADAICLSYMDIVNEFKPTKLGNNPKGTTA